MERFGPEKQIDLVRIPFESIDIKPEKEKSPVPVLVAPGWAMTPKILGKSLEGLASKGRRVLSLAHSRESILDKSQRGHHLVELQKAFALLSIIENLEKEGIEKVDAVAYSEGGINVSIAASEFPEKFRNIVYFAPAGIMGKDSFPKLLGRFNAESIKTALGAITKPETRKPVLVQLTELLKYIKNVPLSVREAIAISQADILQMMEDLKKMGIGISVIHGVDDKIFPMEKVQKNISKQHTDGFYSVKGGHHEIFLHPEKYMGVVEKALTALEKKRKEDKE